MASGSWRQKIRRRAHAPGMIAADLRRVAVQARSDLIRLYALYHQRRQTPGRVFAIPGRQCRMWLPIAWGESVAQRRFGVFEPLTFSTLSEIVRPGAVVLELGACYGEFAIHLSRLVGPSGRVYSFELFPPYFAIAERNIALNGISNVRLINRAVGRDGTPPVRVEGSATHPYAALNQVSGLDYSSRASTTQPREHEVEIETISLRRFLQAEQIDADLVFMDIEGCELEVLHDCQPLLRSDRARPTVYLELHRAFYGQTGVDWLELLFARSGYATRAIAGHLLCTPVRLPQGPPVAPFNAVA